MSYDDLPIPGDMTCERPGSRSRRLTVEEGQALDRLLGKLQDCDLGQWDQDFVDDMGRRIDKFGPSIFISARQEEQIDRLKRQHGLEALK